MGKPGVGRNRMWELRKRWPKKLSNIWLQNIGFLGLCTFSALLLTRPVVSVPVFAGLVVRWKETGAALAVLVAVIAVPAWYHHAYALAIDGGESRALTLTAVAKEGIWTLERVDGSNYWRQQFGAGTLYLEEGEQVTLRKVGRRREKG